MHNHEDDYEDDEFGFEDEGEEQEYESEQNDAEPGLICEECGADQATVHITDLSGDEPVQRHLCKDCAHSLKEYPTVGESEVYEQLLGQIMPELKELSQKVCPGCKLSYLMFRHSGRLGCDECYEAFGEAMESMIERIHGATQHVGKIPPTVDQDVALESRIRTLEQLMQEAVAAEDYERAAQLRDQIQDMKTRTSD